MTAEAAFKRGDNLAAAAAVMDICSSGIPVITSLLAAAGPEGMLVGALFSVIGQLLAFFAPQQPSLEAKIQKTFDNFEAAQHLEKIKGVGLDIAGYTTRLRTAGKDISKITAMPLNTEQETDDLLALTSKDNKTSPVPPDAREDIKRLLIDLMGKVEAHAEDWNDRNTIALKVLNETEPAARARGLYVIIGGDLYLYAAAGGNRLNANWTYLKLGTGGRPYRFSITVPKEDKGSLTPRYHIFCVRATFKAMRSRTRRLTRSP